MSKCIPLRPDPDLPHCHDCPRCGEHICLTGKDAVRREFDTLYIQFFCPSGCHPVLVIDSEKADTRMCWRFNNEGQ